MQEGKNVKKNISVIPPRNKYDKELKVQSKKLRVAAYCRVSTLLEQQESSFNAQMNYFEEKILSNPNWVLVKIYADDGKSATNTKKRDNFKEMIDDCIAGKIDLVLTKSISRFARNTVDCLQTIRILKEKNIPVIFEKEGINTLDGSGELLITILSSQAQEESRNLSENTRWGIMRRNEQGIITVNENRFLGYTKNANKELVIVPEEAEVVRKIFRMCLEGKSSYKIAMILEGEGIKTTTGKDRWQPSTIDKILKNEKYMGDALLQKTVVVDFLTKKRRKNTGIVPQYYIEDDHEAIIPKELFYRVQEELARRAAICKRSGVNSEIMKSKFSSKYALSEILVCSECGHPYRRQIWSKYGQKTPVWRCENRLKNGTRICKNSPTLKEDTLQGVVMKVINDIVCNRGTYIGAFRENVIKVVKNNAPLADEYSQYDDQIVKLQIELLELIDEGAKQKVIDKSFDERYQKITNQIKELKTKKTEQMQEQTFIKDREQRIQDISNYINSNGYVREFDNSLVRNLIEYIKVMNNNKLQLKFKSGIVIEQEIDFY